MLPSFEPKDFDEDIFCKNILNLYTLEGELSNKVNNFLDDVNKDLALYILLFYFSLNKYENNSTDCSLYRVLSSTNCPEDLKKGDLVFNRQFLSTSVNIDESIKYIYEDKEIDKSKSDENEEKVKEYKYIFEIFVRKEKNILSSMVCGLKNYSEFPFEDEFILAPNNIFKIDEIIDKDNKFSTVKMTLESSYFKEKTTLGIYQEKNAYENNMNIILDCENSLAETLDSKFMKIKTKQENLQEIRLGKINSIDCLNEDIFVKETNSILSFTPNLKKIDMSLNNLTSESLVKIAEYLNMKTQYLQCQKLMFYELQLGSE